MSKRLTFIGHDVLRRDPITFLEGLRQRFPNVSETGIQAIAKRELGKKPPRYDQYVQGLFGEDILTDDVTTIAAWRWLTPILRREVQQASLEQRRAMVDPKGLSATYVWRKDNGWVQEVTDSDADILRASGARTWFRDTDMFGTHVPTRMWDFPVIETHTFNNQFDANAYRKEQHRQQQWRGR